jgi:hypothetical protein
MADFMLLMHRDTVTDPDDAAWGAYFARLRAAGVFQGGSAIGGGTCVRKHGAPAELAAQLTGFIRITADDLAHAQTWLAGNPVFEAGGTIEIRALPRE